jgi:hypothetical protein
LFSPRRSLAPPGGGPPNSQCGGTRGSTPRKTAVAEVVAVCEEKTGKQVELAHYPGEELPSKIGAAPETGRPPDIAYGLWIPENIGQWALDDRLVDLTDVIGSFANMVDADALKALAALSSVLFGCHGEDRPGRPARKDAGELVQDVVAPRGVFLQHASDAAVQTCVVLFGEILGDQHDHG